MHVLLSSHDRDASQRVLKVLDPLCRELGKRHEQDMVKLMLAPGVLVAEFFAKDGERAQVPVGLRPLAAALSSGQDTIRKYVDQMIRWARDKQERSRIGRSTAIILPR
jgi:hypothetical protein